MNEAVAAQSADPSKPTIDADQASTPPVGDKSSPKAASPASVSSSSDSEDSVSSLDDGDDLVVLARGFYCPRSGGDAKWHAPHSTEPDLVACNTKGMKLSELQPMGCDPPADPKRVCMRCLRVRPDLHAILRHGFTAPAPDPPAPLPDA